jgi:hypothetical protein
MLSTLLLVAIGGSDFQTTMKHTEGSDFWFEMVPGPAPQGAHGAAIADVPLATMVTVLRDVEHFKEIFPQMTESRLLSRAGRIVSVHIGVVIIGFGGMARIPLSADIKQLEGHEDSGAVTFRQRTAGQSSFRRYDIDVRLTPLSPQKTLIEMWGSVVPDIPLVPDSLIEEENRKLVRRGVRALRLRAVGATFNPNDL